MIVLHAICDSLTSTTLHIWAELSDKASSSSQSETPSEKASTRNHPFVLSHAALKEVLGRVVNAPLLKRAGMSTLSLRLPSTSKAPTPSPELIVEEQPDIATNLKWWNVESLTFPAGLALDLLLALPESSPYNSVYGGSLRFWTTVAKFAFELITKQAFIPTLQEAIQDGITLYQAVWKAFLSSEDAERMNVLVHAMPPLCWSFMPSGEKKVSLLHEVVQKFLDQSVDAFVRESLPSNALVSSRSHRKTGPEQWLQALSSENPTLSAASDELQQFAISLAAWLETLRPVAANAPFRTCFRLETPETDEQAWRVSFHLQANDDRSLLVPADDVWQESSDTLTFLNHKFENPQERLLTDLGRASRLFPILEESLKSAHPRELALSTEEAYAFLRQSVPLLEQSGFGVLVPPWWQKNSARLKVKLKLKPKSDPKVSLGLMGLDSIVSYDWNAAVGDSELTEEDFERLVNLKTPLVQVRGQWVELRPEEIEAAISFFQKKRKRGEMKLGEALGLGLGQGMSETGLQVATVEGNGWVKDLLDGLTQDVGWSTIDVPNAFYGTLRPYQLKGVSWLAFLKKFGLGACLADDMGLGKTAQLIALLLYDRAHRNGNGKQNATLVICPMSIVGNWQRELRRFAPSLKVMVHHGMERLSGQAFVDEVEKHDVVITTYSLALRDKEHLAPITWEQVVIDEAQNIKNEAAKQTQAIKKLDANYKIALTGTPVENRLSELWSIMEFLNPGYLGSGTEFHKNYATPIERYHNVKRADALKRLTQPFILRRLKTDKKIIQDLPEKMEMKVFCNLTQEQASLYEAVVQEMLARIEEADGIERRGLVLATLIKLKQVCNHPAQFMGDGSRLEQRSGKLNRLEEMLEEVVAAGDKALIFTQFAEMGTLLRTTLQERLNREVLFLHGGTLKKQRDMMVQRFQEERRGSPLFILSLKAGGVGLNLTAANHVFHFDRWWNPAVENQATDRAFRIGQKKNVQVHKFVCVGTLEERIDQMIEQKKELAESIIGNGENWLTEMSTSQLKELFTLSREAVGE